jgi:hypothetical protein
VQLPGFGRFNKSISKFVDLDLANQEVFGIDPARRPDEGFVNQFDIKHQKQIAEREANVFNNWVCLEQFQPTLTTEPDESVTASALFKSMKEDSDRALEKWNDIPDSPVT